MSDRPNHPHAEELIGEVVWLAGLLSDAAPGGDPIRYAARESDFDELLAPLCKHTLRDLVLFMGTYLAVLGWKPGGRPDAVDVDPDEPLPVSPPEVKREDGSRG